MPNTVSGGRWTTITCTPVIVGYVARSQQAIPPTATRAMDVWGTPKSVPPARDAIHHN